MPKMDLGGGAVRFFRFQSVYLQSSDGFRVLEETNDLLKGRMYETQNSFLTVRNVFRSISHLILPPLMDFTPQTPLEVVNGTSL